MSIKTIALIAGAVILAAAGWYFRDSGPVREAGDSVAGFATSILPDNSYTVAKNDAVKSSEPGAPHSLRKCVSDTRTVYTDEKCPAGSREAPISEGNVTVVPGPRPSAPAKGEEKAK